MRENRRQLRLGVLVALTFVLTMALWGTSSEKASAQTSFDHEIIELINDHRESIGLDPFTTSSSISDGAQSWSEEMLRTGFRHDPSLPSLGLGENIAGAQGEAGALWNYGTWPTAAGPMPSYCQSRMDGTTAEMIVCIWLSSTDGHRDAIESGAYRQIGVGSASSGSPTRTTYVTARFSTEAPAPVASFSSPDDGAQLCSGDTISWSGPDSGKYRLRLGTSRNGTQIMNQSTNAESVDVVPLPADRTLYATLMYRPNGGSWVTADTRTFSPCANPVELNTTNTLCSGDEMTWSGPSSGRYKLRIGTDYDGTQAMNQGTSRRSIDAAPNLPTGVDLYVSLRHKGADGVWRLQAAAVYAPCAKPIEIIAPNSNARLCDNDLIDWVGRSSGKYRIRIGTSPDGTDVLNKSTDATKYNVGDIADTSGTLYVSLRHQTVDGGRWALHYTMELRSC